MSGSRFDADFREKLDCLFLWRRDVRHFRLEPLLTGAIDELLELACRGPSAGNAQPWRFVRVLSAERRAVLVAHIETYQYQAGQIYDEDKRILHDRLKLHGLREAPEVLAVFCDENGTAGHGLGRQTMPETLCWSVVAAVQILWLAARARGIGLGWVSILDPAAMNAVLDVSSEWRFIGLMCLGYPAQESETPELINQGWQDRLPASVTRFTR